MDAVRIRQFIDEQINKYSDIYYGVSLYQEHLDKDYIKKEQSDTSYDIAEWRYIPIMIESIEGEHVEIPNVEQAEFTVVSTFMIPTNDRYIDNVIEQANTRNVLDDVDTMRNDLQGSKLPLGRVGYRLYDDSNILLSYPGNDNSIVRFELRFKHTGDPTILFDSNQLTVSHDNDAVNVEVKGETKTEPLVEGGFNEIVVRVEETETKIVINDTTYTTSNDTSIDISEGKIKGNQNLLYDIIIQDDLGTENNYLILDNFDTLENKAQTTDKVVLSPSTGYGTTPMGDEGNLTLSMSMLNPITNQFSYQNDEFFYQLFDMTFEITINKDVFTANDYKYYLDGIEIHPMTANASYSTVNPAHQQGNAKTSKTVIEENSMGRTFGIYGKNNPLYSKLSKNMFSKDKEQNQSFDLEIHYPTYKESYEVVVTQGGNDLTYNSPDIFTFSIMIKNTI